jgi:quinol monooxygenase YgiN
MIFVLAALETAAGRRDDLIAMFRTLAPIVRAEKGCIEYNATVDTPSGLPPQDALRPNVVVVVEKWESVEALHAHLATSHMVDFGKQGAKIGLKMTLQVVTPV